VTLNAFITGVKNGQVHRKITLLHRAAFSTTAKESLWVNLGANFPLSKQERNHELNILNLQQQPKLNKTSKRFRHFSQKVEKRSGGGIRFLTSSSEIDRQHPRLARSKALPPNLPAQTSSPLLDPSRVRLGRSRETDGPM
jgi:hypothetical protein